MDAGRPLTIVHTESSWGWGGQEVRILTEARGFLERGHDVRVVCTPESTMARRAHEFGVPAETIDIQKKNGAGLKAAYNWLRRNSVDIINTHSSTDSWLFSLAARGMRRRPGIVRTRHVGLPVSRNIASNWLYRRGADFVVTCGVEIVNSLATRNGVRREKMRSIPTGIDTTRFQPGDPIAARKELGLPLDRKLVGIVAALRREKGHIHLCEAMRDLPRDDFDLVFVGDGLSRPMIEEKIEELGLSARVHRVGHQANVVRWLQALDLFALPSFGSVEGVPQSIMQAMSCQLPVLTTSAGSIREAVEHEVTGLIVPPGDVASLASSLNRLLDDEALCRRLAEAGHCVAQQRFRFETMLDRMEEVFYRVHASSPAGKAGARFCLIPRQIEGGTESMKRKSA